MKSMNYKPLDFAQAMVYSSRVAEKKATGLGSLIEAANSRKRKVCGFFISSGASSMAGRAGKPQGLPVPHRSSYPVRSASLLGSWEAGSKPNNEASIMTNIVTNPSTKSLVSIINGHAVTTSKQIADLFGKLHKNVLQSIENIKEDLGKERYELNFQPIQIDSDLGVNRTRKDPAYNITRDGFTLLAMGFTGKKALQFKLAYIDQFNAMEKTLRAAYTTQPTDTITAAQAEQLRTMITQKYLSMPKDKQAQFITKAWSKLKSHFGVTYRKIPQAEFTEALSLVARHVSEWELLEAPQEEPQSKEQILNDALKNGRWFISSSEGRLILTPVRDDAYVISADEFAKVLREPGEIPIKLLPGIIESAAGRLRNHYGDKFCKDEHK